MLILEIPRYLILYFHQQNIHSATSCKIIKIHHRNCASREIESMLFACRGSPLIAPRNDMECFSGISCHFVHSSNSSQCQLTAKIAASSANLHCKWQLIIMWKWSSTSGKWAGIVLICRILALDWILHLTPKIARNYCVENVHKWHTTHTGYCEVRVFSGKNLINNNKAKRSFSHIIMNETCRSNSYWMVWSLVMTGSFHSFGLVAQRLRMSMNPTSQRISSVYLRIVLN